MNCGVQIASVNLNGQTVYVTFLPLNGGSIDLGEQVMPFDYYDDYYWGTYEVYSPLYNTTYSIVVPFPVTPTLTPTPTVTPTPITPTPGVTSTPTPTPTSTPPVLFSAYIFPEPQDSTSAYNLGEFMYNNGASNFFGFSNSGVPPITDYQSDLILYASYSGFTTAGFGNYIEPVTSFTSAIRQTSGTGTDSFGCTQAQYTFGSIEIPLASVNDNIDYFYSVWIPLDGVGGSMNNMTVDISYGSACNPSIIGSIPVPSLSEINVTLPSGSAIPAGTYRVLWMPVSGLQPVATTLTSALYFKGNTKN